MKKLAEGLLIAGGLVHGLSALGLDLLGMLPSWASLTAQGAVGLSAGYALYRMFK